MSTWTCPIDHLRARSARRASASGVAPGVGTIVTDGAMLGHVVMNLVANAVKFTPVAPAGK